MKNIRKKFSILLPIIIIMFFTKLSICQDNKNNFYSNENNNLEEEFYDLWQQNKELPIQMCISPGCDESKINFSWYSKDTDSPSKFKFYYGEKEVRIKVDSINIGNGFISNKAEVANLISNTTYHYSYTINGKWIDKVTYKTKGSNKFSFAFMGDPQIGASYKSKGMSSYEEAIKLDAYNWNKVIEKAMEKRNSCSFILCGGDETNTKNDYSDKNKENINRMEYCGLLCPRYLRYTPLVNTIGNHDEKNIDFYYHFNTPNASNLGETKAGGDYYFTYSNTLFLILNTNNLNIDEHEAFIKDSIKTNSNAKWKIAVFHHDIYGCGIHSNDSDVKLLRDRLPLILEKNNINLVLNGHDHIYSRSYILSNNRIIKNSRIKNNIEKINLNLDETIYITGGSSTGSKFYKKSYDDKNYIDAKFQEDISTYTIIDISEDSIVINTFRVDNGNEIDNTIEIN